MKQVSMEQIAKLLRAETVNHCDLDASIEHVTCDSRAVRPGSLFFAYLGPELDGHKYVEDAFKKGAVAAVVTNKSACGSHPCLIVDDSRQAFSQACAEMYGHPSHKMKVIGITGTNGKTTIHWMLYHALNRLGWPALRIGSLGIAAETANLERSGKVATLKAGEIVMTTPGPEEIQKSMALALTAGVKACVLETSSHGIHQKRVGDVRFNAAVFTNLTPDHLNYHPDMETYFQVKTELFHQVAMDRQAKNEALGGAIINQDCDYGRRLTSIAQALHLPIFSFGHKSHSKIQILDFEQGLPTSKLTLRVNQKNYVIHMPLIGDYNASNMAAAFATLLSFGFSPEELSVALSHQPVVPGRLEPVGTERVAVFVDYAHTGIGLDFLLGAVKAFVEGKLWVVFGCGGGKDPRKRIEMGDAARKHADHIVLTDDNPKNEDPEEIIKDILKSGCQPTLIVHDRAAAIRDTLARAEEGDVVILAGKGHEDYQIIGNHTSYFSDRDEVHKAIKEGILI